MQNTVLNEAEDHQLRGARHQHQVAVEDLVSEVLREEVPVLEVNPGHSQHKCMGKGYQPAQSGELPCTP